MKFDFEFVMDTHPAYCEYCKRDLATDELDAAETIIRYTPAPGETDTMTIYECEECRDARYEAMSEYIA
jgi:hypothetical protein